MRLVAWNCGGGFHRKAAALLALEPDVAVVSECAGLERLLAKVPWFQPAGALWTGDVGQKGLAIFSFGAYRLASCRNHRPAITYALPVRVEGPTSFNLLGLWAHHHKAPLSVRDPGPTLGALAAYQRLLRRGPTIVAGDLNNHIRWDRPRKASNHANAITAFGRLGMVSAYHHVFGVAQGGERHPTLYWRDRTETGPTYHIDYVFLPRGAAAHILSFSIGRFADWTAAGLSDHVPLILDLDPRFAAADALPVRRKAPASGRGRSAGRPAPARRAQPPPAPDSPATL
jgi:exodeoxyribonuclease-3